MKYCIYKEFPGFLPILNPLEIKDRLKKDDTVPCTVASTEVDRYGAFLEWYEEIFNGKRDLQRGLEMVQIWKKDVIQLSQEYLGNDEISDKQRNILGIRLLCLGWIPGESTMVIE